MKAAVSIIPSRILANISVDFHGVTQEFTNVDITDTDTVWVAIDDLGTCSLFCAEPYHEDGYWQLVEPSFSTLSGSCDPEISVNWENSLLSYKVK